MRNAALTVLVHAPRRRTSVIPVAIAETEEEKHRGLSFQRHVERALVFPHHGESSARYTFANMVAPIDLVVVDRAAVVREVLHNVQPQSPDVVFAGYPISLVIEMPAGAVARHDIAIGASVLSLF